MATNTHIVNILASQTGMGLELCKFALEKTNNDVNAAKRYIDKWVNPKKQSNKPSGFVTSMLNKDVGAAALFEVRCNNDLVMDSKQFKQLMTDCLEEVASYEHYYVNEEAVHKLEQAHDCKVEIKTIRFARSNDRCLLTTYCHHERISVLVETEVSNPILLNHRALKAFSFDCALHVAAFKPIGIDKQDIPIEAQDTTIKEIERVLLRDGKAMHLWPTIIEGKIGKWLEQRSMLNQIWIKSEKETVREIKQQIEHQIGCEIKINRIAKLELGQ